MFAALPENTSLPWLCQMIRITASAQHVGPGPIAVTDVYLERIREVLERLYRGHAITLDGRRLCISGDLLFPAGTAYTTATVEFRFLGDCIVYNVDGRIIPGHRAWAGFVLSLGLSIGEVLLWPRSVDIMIELTIAKWLGVAATGWYLTTFLYFAVVTRRQVVTAVQRVCKELERHD